MRATIEPAAVNDLIDLQEDVASQFTADHLMSGQMYWTCVECLAQTKLLELDGRLNYDRSQRF